ncbi:MAG: hypothetical protein K2I64_07015 [Muribaculaceae bacterium]|nr:hypothetical protein [Muribaculaceae bacterium]
MKKPILSRWILTALAAMTVLGASAASKKFTAVTSNVDGLPPVVHIDYVVGSRDIHMNDDGSQEPGATRMGQLIGENLWDIVALSEDFNYHSYIMNGVSTYYNAGKWRGLIDQSNLNGSLLNYPSATPTDNKGLYMKTDGLGFLTRKKYSVTPGTDAEGEGKNWIPWNDHYGFTENEADGLIRKGFRFYQVTLAEGLVVDVYITHMEAGSDPEDNAARAKQLTQFAEYIKAHKGTNPIIILGDTNCRYTRDPLEEGFINLIQQDTDLEVKDPWVEIRRKGVYPTPNSPSIMVSQYGEQDGEVVDKIWYINNKKSDCTLTCIDYLHDDSFTYADGSQIADHYPVVGTFIIDNPDAPNTSTEVVIPEAPEKKAVVSGQTYYLRNLGSGKFLRAGGAWTTQAVMGDYPSKFKLTNKSGKKWTLQSTHDNKWLRYDGNNYFVDQAENEWTLEPVKDNVYTLADADGNPVGFANGVVAKVASNPSDKNQQWEFLTQADLMHELYYASSASPKDVTFLMKCPDFGYADQETWTTSKGNNASHGKERPNGVEHVSFWKASNGQGGLINGSSGRNWNLSQTISGLPAGTYVVTYQAATYNMSDNQTFTINGADAPCSDLGSSDPGSAKVANNLAAGMYSHSVTVSVDNSGKIEISVVKKATKSATGAYYDNFNIKCIGLDGIPDLAMYDRVKVAIDDAKAKAAEAGLSNYRNGQVETLWAEQEITGDGWAEVKRTYKNLGEAVLQVKDIPADYTYALVNPSFELYPDYKDSRYTIDGGFPFGWSYSTNYAKDSGVWPASDANKSTSNPDGEYIFNSWPEGNAVYQEVTLTPGIYKLTAKVASDANNQVYLYAADKTASVTTTGKEAFNDITLHFAVTDGKPFQLGVAGSASKTGGAWFKADDFHLTRIGNAETIKGMEMLQLAINQATERAKALNGYSSGFAAEMAKYQAMIDNYTLEGDGKKEFDEVYDALRAIIYALPTTDASGKAKEVDYTYAIANNSFEWGNTYGWNLKSPDGDTNAKPNSDNTYKMSGCDGNYMFNTWNDGGSQGGRGTIISQKINNLPAGHYRLDAVFANDPNAYVYLEVQGQEGVASQKEQFQLADDKDKGATKSLQFDVAEGTPSITIFAGGCNNDGSWDDFGGAWYKVDNFRLTRMGDAKICFFYKRLRDAIDEANSVASELPKKYASQWDPSDYQDLIDKHLADGHDPDAGETSEKYDPLNGGSGIAEITELFDRLRALIFSQTETGADMSGAITNNSFELGDLTGWQTDMIPTADAQVTPGHNNGVYTTEGTDGTYLYNAWTGDTATPIWQTIPNVPSGRYTLTVKIASDAGNSFFLGANAKHSELITIPDSDIEGVEAKAIFHDYSFTFEVPVEAESKDVKIGVYPTYATSTSAIEEKHFASDAVGPWYKIDHFRLTLDSRYMEIDWEMESDTHGTIMLPFSVEKETLDEMQLEAYTIKMATESSNNTPADEDINTYRLLTWDGPHNGMIANVPYVLKNVAPQAEPAANKVRAKVGEGNDDAAAARTYKFVGYTHKTPEDVISPEGNLLTGTLVDVPAEQLQHHFTQVDDNVGFVLHDNADDNGVSHETVPAYHAYIELPAEALVENGHWVTGLYFYEPVQYLDWEMETEDYGTLILPFDAPLPDGLKAYRLFDADDETVKNVTLGDTEGETYQLLNLTEVTETMEVADEDGNTVEKVKLTANTPYLIERTSAPNASKKRASAKAGEAETSGYYQFSGKATNTEESYKLEGLMTGVIVSRDDNMGYDENGQFTQNSLDAGDRVLTGDAETGYRFEALTDRTALPRYHAYIDSETKNGENALATHILFEEPDYTVEWSMEGGQYGTIILPFEADVPDGYEAYTLTGTEGAEQTSQDYAGSYQILTKAEANTLEANKAYLMVTVSSSDEPVAQTMSVPVEVNGDVCTFTGKRTTNEIPVENGALTGSYTKSTPEAGDYVLTSDGHGFAKATEDGNVEGLHAYIKKDAIPGATANYLVLAEDDVPTGIDEIMAGDVNVDVYNLQGVMLKANVAAPEALDELAPGIYILRAGNKTVKVLK